ncbi:MAG: hypothetical protein GWM89_12605 [Candidatus Dadabacteria bacterium]|nr:hypothetical protein [Candidatus Dadabacteria bacterium]NIX16663.1 hypothetical protein [Candidatus Dadabacteria bacterium]NIY23229.1 hypothetical protein [Candidatus Dadabacteria bacterium]
MSVMSIRIDEKKRKALKMIAAIEGKNMSTLVGDLIDQYILNNKKKIINTLEQEQLIHLMELSETSFSEWDNREDEIYDEL